MASRATRYETNCRQCSKQIGVTMAVKVAVNKNTAVRLRCSACETINRIADDGQELEA